MRQFSFRFWKSTAVVFSLVVCGVAILAATALGAFANLDSRVDVDGPAGISGGRDAGELDAVGGTVTAGAARTCRGRCSRSRPRASSRSSRERSPAGRG